jgi:molybdenum cofactor cytidylyltransferase
VLTGIVLAAGRSSRIGQPKAFLAAGEDTFIDRILKTLADARLPRALVVVRGDDQRLIDHVQRHEPSARAVINPRADEGQLSSLVTGLDVAEADGAEAVLVTLVDAPLIRADTVRALIERLAHTSALVLRASYDGRHGHPVIFRRATFDALRKADPAVGAKQVLQQFASLVEDVEVTDPGTLRDVDTVEDYIQIFGHRP